MNAPYRGTATLSRSSQVQVPDEGSSPKKVLTIVERAASAIANERGGRHGAPPIVNVLEILPPKLHDEVMEDARAVLAAIGFDDLLATLKEVSDTSHDCETSSECAVLIARGEAVSCARLTRAHAVIAEAEGRR